MLSSTRRSGPFFASAAASDSSAARACASAFNVTRAAEATSRTAASSVRASPSGTNRALLVLVFDADATARRVFPTPPSPDDRDEPRARRKAPLNLEESRSLVRRTPSRRAAGPCLRRSMHARRLGPPPVVRHELADGRPGDDAQSPLVGFKTMTFTGRFTVSSPRATVTFTVSSGLRASRTV